MVDTRWGTAHDAKQLPYAFLQEYGQLCVHPSRFSGDWLQDGADAFDSCAVSLVHHFHFFPEGKGR